MDLILDPKNTKWVEGIFNEISKEMRVSLVNMSIKNVLSARFSDQLDLSKQQTSKIRKKELLCDKTVLSVIENIFMYYIIM